MKTTENKKQHTPGQWYVGGEYHTCIEVRSNMPSAIEHPLICEGRYIEGDESNAQANAKLIASAPGMLEALQRIAIEAERGNTSTIIGICTEIIEKTTI